MLIRTIHKKQRANENVKYIVPLCWLNMIGPFKVSHMRCARSVYFVFIILGLCHCSFGCVLSPCSVGSRVLLCSIGWSRTCHSYPFPLECSYYRYVLGHLLVTVKCPGVHVMLEDSLGLGSLLPPWF